MAQLQYQAFDVPQAVAAGTVLALKPYRGTYTFWWNQGGAVCTGQLQIAVNSNGPWTNEGSPFSASGSINVSSKARFARINVTAYTSGQAEAEIVGEV